jgi:uncharacterized membrane protein
MTEPAVLPQPAQAPALKQDVIGMVLLATTLLLMVALFLWLAATYNNLPDLLPLHFDAQGNPDRIVERREIFDLPTIGLLINLVNIAGGLLLRQRFRMVFAPYLLWAGAMLVQVLIWIAVWNITQ